MENNSSNSQQTGRSLIEGLEYLEKVVNHSLSRYFQKPSDYDKLEDIPLPEYKSDDTLGRFVRFNKLDFYEHILLLMAIAPHLKADFYDSLISAILPEEGEFPLFGGVRGKQFRGFLPTGETVLFLIGGLDLQLRLQLHSLFDANHPFVKQRIIYLDTPPDNEPRMCGKLIINDDYVGLFTIGHFASPQFSVHFPAQKIETEMNWDDLVLNAHTNSQIQELETWIKHSSTLMFDWGMKKKIKKGYRSLFYGPPGTGKTLTASLLGKYTGREVYKIDLSTVLSKYIGETEKNLANLFARAENKNWILFFDEADALFGKRTSVRDAHDKYANQEVSYLLQRVEDYDGLVILASNFKSNIDEAFVRRFQSIIYFPPPKEAERIQLWQKAFPSAVQIADNLDLNQIAKDYELTGASIMNIVQFVCLKALGEERNTIYTQDIRQGISREFSKEGKVFVKEKFMDKLPIYA